MDINKTIGYKPDLHYTDEYLSDASNYFKEESDNNLTLEEDVIDDLLQEGEDVENLIDKLPGNLSDIIDEVFDHVNDFIENELKDKDLEKVPVELEWEYKNPDPGDLLPGDQKPLPEPGFDEDDFWEIDDPAPLEKEEHTKAEVFEKEYIKNLVDLFDDYFSNLKSIISNYWANLLFAASDKRSSEIKLILDNILLDNSEIKGDASHLLDSAVRFQIIRNMKLDYFNNNFNSEETIKHLQQFKAVQELRLRYAKIEKLDAKNNSDQMSNNILQGMLLTYDKKYDMAYANLYKYLNSSNVVLKDALSSYIQEIKSKQTLIERKGIK